MNHHLYHIPAKIFLLGEYSVLSGEPALVAAIRLHEGESFYGFGSSTANYILESSRALGSTATENIWNAYCKENPHASGADLIAQSEALKGKGSIFKIQVKNNAMVATAMTSFELLNSIHVFSAASSMSRKLNTDHHLKTLPQELNYPKSEIFIDRFLNAKNVSELSVISEWADLFNELQLETNEAKLDRDYIQSLPGVTGVKGCGAGLNDVFIVAIDQKAIPSVSVLTQFISKERNLSYQGTLQSRLWSNE